MNTDTLTAPASLRSREASLRGVAGVTLVVALIGAMVLGALWAHRAGWGLVSVHGGSMGDAIPNGSLVITKTEPASNVAAGDVILIRVRAEDGSSSAPKLHRVMAIENLDGQVVVRTKGDANADPDHEKYVLPQQTLVEQWHIPRLGYWFSFLVTPQGWLLAAALPFTAVAAIAVASIWRKKPVTA